MATSAQGPDLKPNDPKNWSNEKKEAWLAENEKIIHRAIQSYRNVYEYDDLRQMAYEAALKAFNAFDPSRSVKLSTYVFRAIKNEINMAIRADTAKKRSATVVPFSQSDGEDGVAGRGAENMDTSESDWLHQPQTSIESAIEKREACIFIRKVVKEKLTDTEQTVFRMMVSGETQVEIGKHLMCSQAKISNIQRIVRAKLIFELRKAGFELSD